MSSPVDRLDELPPVPRRTPAPRRTGRYVLLLVTILLVANAFVGERGLLALLRANKAHARLQQVIEDDLIHVLADAEPQKVVADHRQSGELAG